MGWTYTDKVNGLSLDDFFSAGFLSGRFEWIGKGSLRNFREYYRAVHDKKEDVYFAAIILVDLRGDNSFNFGYKAMDETMGCCECNCPKRILEIIAQSPPRNEWSAKWREKCWAKFGKTPPALDTAAIETNLFA